MSKLLTFNLKLLLIISTNTIIFMSNLLNKLSIDDILNNTQHYIAVYTKDLTIVYINQNLASLYGNFKAEELIGEKVLNINPQFLNSVFYECAMQTINSGIETSRIGYSNLFNGWFATRMMKYDENRFVMIAHSLSKDLNYSGFVPIHDSLTSLYNKHKFQEDLNNSLQQKIPFNILILEISNLDKINEIYGIYHTDCLIMELSAQLKLLLHKSKLVETYKISNNQFAIINFISYAHNSNIIDQINDVFQKNMNITSTEKIKLNHVMSINHIQNFHKNSLQILEESFQTLNTAKKKKLLSLEFNETQSLNKKALLDEIKDGFKNNQFQLYYQPQVDLINNKICGVEALIRWNHPKKGLLAPAAFLSFMEDFELMEVLDKFVIKKSIQDSVFFKKSKFHLPISINLSANSFANPKIVDFFTTHIDKENLINHQIIIEITETALMQNIELSKKVIAQFLNKNFKIAIDDFGSGYSSFGYLVRYPTDYLKIDKEFITNIHLNDNLKQIVMNLVNMAHGLNMIVIAEGVEIDKEAKILKKLGVDIIQGYFYGLPTTKEQILQRITQEGLSSFKSSLI